MTQLSTLMEVPRPLLLPFGPNPIQLCPCSFHMVAFDSGTKLAGYDEYIYICFLQVTGYSKGPVARGRHGEGRTGFHCHHPYSP